MKMLRLLLGKGPTPLGPLESRIMDVLWAAGEPLSVAEVKAALDSRRGELNYSTVRAVLANLTAKKYLRRTKEGRNHLFVAAETRERFKDRVVNQVLKSLAGDYRNPLMAHLVESLATDQQSIRELERLIAEKKAKLRNE
jgi:predicted transcriptional regulator